ncbi:MAG: hypothetical protein COB17_08240 [Sulfurimonas sp.]|nr:MAG: hypothetical protein COB17_08240 [Sulfurimonas sp.]
MKKFLLQNLWWVTFLSAFALLVIHSFNLANISVNSTSIVLLLIMLISPFIIAIKKIKYGDFEAEIDSEEIKTLKLELEKAITSKPDENIEQAEIFKTTDAIRKLAESDPVIALAKVRIELEKTLTRLERITLVDTQPSSLGTLVRKLINHEIISSQVGKSLSNVISLCNRAIHGEYIAKEDALTVVELGNELLEDLDWRIAEQTNTHSIVSEEIISPNKSNEYYKKRYQITTITPYVENPKKIVRELTQEQLDDFLDGYNEYAEFIVKLIELPE